jgi:hypothetical protein
VSIPTWLTNAASLVIARAVAFQGCIAEGNVRRNSAIPTSLAYAVASGGEAGAGEERRHPPRGGLHELLQSGRPEAALTELPTIGSHGRPHALGSRIGMTARRRGFWFR